METSSYHDEMTKAVPDSILHQVTLNSENIIQYMQKQVVCYGKLLKDMPIVIPEDIKTPLEIRKWIYVYLKMVKRYKVLYNEKNQPEYANRGVTSLYEEIGFVCNHKNVYEYYNNKLPVCRREHENYKRIKNDTWYTWHIITPELFSKITYELSQVL